MKKLLFITPELPWPARSGGKIKTFRLLESLAERYAVTLASPLKGDDEALLTEFHAHSPCRLHLHSPVEVPRSPATLLRSYLEGHPLNVHRTFDPALCSRIADVVADYDLVVLDHFEVFPYLPREYSGLVVYHAHNAYHQFWRRYAGLPGNPLTRLAALLESSRVRRYEVAVTQRADLVFASPNDAAALVGAGAPAARMRNTFHLGDDSHLGLPDLRFDDSMKKLVYVGYLGWEPNAQGLLWFIQTVWPRLCARYPFLRFDIVGKGADGRLVAAAAANPGIRLCGFVENLETVYQSSRVSVAPLRFGSGMKVKVLDAMARGLPVVTTPVGAEGIDAEHGRHLMVAADPDGMAKSITALLEDGQLWQRLQCESRALVRARYTWKALFRDMHRALDAALEPGVEHVAGQHSEAVAFSVG